MPSSLQSDSDDFDKSISEWIQDVDGADKHVQSTNADKSQIPNRPAGAADTKQGSYFLDLLGFGQKPRIDPQTVVSPADVYPREMSCTQQFDELVKCYSIGGQVRHVYRYGSIRDCNDRWDMFKFCMAIKMETDEVKERKVYEYYKNKVAADLKNGSSEDVWLVRTKVRKPLFVETDDNANESSK
ncbi:hypothetical protein V1512DRAFT_256805 [Lipomyces arxii]|uniref:uncharacterized protein n=1 Tax=Lipomyces arxii TaxID=56418 RepID=UPI0034CD5316